MINTLLVKNLDLLRDIRSKNPSATHVYIRRFKNGIDIGWVDVPVAQAEYTLRNNPTWELLSSNKQMDDEVEKLFADDKTDVELEQGAEVKPVIDVPPRPSQEMPEVPIPPKPDAKQKGKGRT